MCFYKRGRVEKAKLAFRRAIQLDDENEEAQVKCPKIPFYHLPPHTHTPREMAHLQVALATIERSEGKKRIEKARERGEDVDEEKERQLNKEAMEIFAR